MNEMKNVLFLCPHAAAKSVLAMVYFEQLAQERGLKVTVSNAGTEPDPVINPKVDAYLKARGVELVDFVPTLLTEAMLKTADFVISIGCLTKREVPAGTHFLDWSDVPMLSDDFDASIAKIKMHVAALAAKFV